MKRVALLVAVLIAMSAGAPQPALAGWPLSMRAAKIQARWFERHVCNQHKA